MTDKPKRPRDANQLAKYIVDLATGGEDGGVSDVNKAQQRGGRKGGNARAKKLSAAQRSEIASAAANARWKKH